jgi:tetratricopeptide (TPR) repeat protein
MTMLQRILAALSCLTLAAAFSGCGTLSLKSSSDQSADQNPAPSASGGNGSQASADNSAQPAQPAQPSPADLAIADANKTVAQKMDDLADALASRAAAKQQKPDLPGAKADLDTLIQIQASNALALLCRGEIVMSQSGPTAAMADYSKAIDILSASTAPDHVSGTDALTKLLAALFPGMIQNMPANAYYLRGAARQAKGDGEGALSDFNQAISAAPDFAAAYNNRGVIKGMFLRDADGAAADFNKSLDLQPKAADALANRGNIEIAQGNYDAAVKDYDKAIELSPNWPVGYFDRAFAKQRSGDLDGAIADLTKAIDLKADYTDAYFNRAVDYDRQAKYAEAMADYDRVIVMNPSAADAYAGRGMDRYRRNDINAAISDFNRAIALKKDSARNYLDRAVASYIQGDLKRAIDDYQHAIELTDKDSASYPQLFRSVALMQDHQDPKKDLATAMVDWKDGWPKTIGRYLTGDLNESAFLAEAERADPKIAGVERCDAYYFVGMTHLLAGDNAAAKNFFDQCLAVNLPDRFSTRFAQSQLTRLASAQ